MIDPKGTVRQYKIEYVASPCPVLVDKMQVIACHGQSLGIVGRAVARECTGHIFEMEGGLFFCDFGERSEWPFLPGNCAGRYLPELAVDADGEKQVVGKK